LLSNKYLQDSNKDFSGYEIKVKDDNVYEISKVESKSQKTMTIEKVELRELKTNLEVPIFNGVQSSQSVGGKPIDGTPCQGLSSEGIFVNVKECGEFSGHCDAKAGLCVKIGCLNDNDCAKGYTCQSNVCKGGKRCNQHTDCDAGFECSSSKKCVAVKCSEDNECGIGLSCSILTGYSQGVCAKKTSPGARTGSSAGEPEQIIADKESYVPSVIILEPMAQGEKEMTVNAYFIYNTVPKETVNEIVSKFSPCMEKSSTTNDFVKGLKELNPNLPEASDAPISEGSVAIKVPKLGYSYERGSNTVNINGCKWAAKKSMQSVVTARVPQAIKAAARGGEFSSCRTDSECADSERCANGFCMQKVADGCKDYDSDLGDEERQKFRRSVVIVYKSQQKVSETSDACGGDYVLNEAVCENGKPSIKALACGNGCADGKCSPDARTATIKAKNTYIPCLSSADCVYQNGVCENSVCMNYQMTVTRKGDMLCNAMDDCVPVCKDYDGGYDLSEAGQYSIKSNAVTRDIDSNGQVAIRSVLEDRCVNAEVMEEATCDGATAKMSRVLCANGCSDRKCASAKASEPIAERDCRYDRECPPGMYCDKDGFCARKVA
ncbi:MAG: hypothetical protein AABY09_01740, partial [Nanoarchaeota archaeon]